MKRTTRKNIKSYVSLGLAKDITNYSFDQVQKLLHNINVDKIAYSAGINGINAGLFQDKNTGEMYAITTGNSVLLQVF